MQGFNAEHDNKSPAFLCLCLSSQYRAYLEYSWAFKHLVIPAMEHQLQDLISLAYPPWLRMSYFSSAD